MSDLGSMHFSDKGCAAKRCPRFCGSCVRMYFTAKGQRGGSGGRQRTRQSRRTAFKRNSTGTKYHGLSMHKHVMQLKTVKSVQTHAIITPAAGIDCRGIGYSGGRSPPVRTSEETTHTRHTVSVLGHRDAVHIWEHALVRRLRAFKYRKAGILHPSRPAQGQKRGVLIQEHDQHACHERNEDAGRGKGGARGRGRARKGGGRARVREKESKSGRSQRQHRGKQKTEKDELARQRRIENRRRQTRKLGQRDRERRSQVSQKDSIEKEAENGTVSRE